MGLGMGVFPELKLTHLIPKERVAPEYLLRIFEGTEISNLLLAYKWKGDLPWSLFSGRRLLSVLKNVPLRQGIDRRMYLANVCGAVEARRIISASRPLRDGVGRK
jgi:hypothetical protein